MQTLSLMLVLMLMKVSI